MTPERDRLDFVEKRVDIHDTRLLKVENSHEDLKKEVVDIKIGMAQLHGDLKAGNERLASIDRSTQRIERSTEQGIEDIKKSVQGAIELANTTKTLSTKPFTVVALAAMAAFIAAGMAFSFFFRG